MYILTALAALGNLLSLNNLIQKKVFINNKEKYFMKRSRARVPVGGQCVLLQISLRTKILDFFLNSQNYRMNHI